MMRGQKQIGPAACPAAKDGYRDQWSGRWKGSLHETVRRLAPGELPIVVVLNLEWDRSRRLVELITRLPCPPIHYHGTQFGMAALETLQGPGKEIRFDTTVEPHHDGHAE